MRVRFRHTVVRNRNKIIHMKVTIKIEICADIEDAEALKKQALRKVKEEIIWEDHEDRAIAIADVRKDLRCAVQEVLDIDAVLENVDSMSIDGHCSRVILEECSGECEC